MSVYRELECLICNKIFSSRSIKKHLKESHEIEEKEYYDRYLKSSNEGLCIECGRTTKFRGLFKGYNKLCSDECFYRGKVIPEKRKRTSLERYGVEHPPASKESRLKSQNTLFKHYGVRHPLQSKEIRSKSTKTYQEKYGGNFSLAHSPITKQKRINTNLSRFGTSCPLSSDKVKKKISETVKEKYGAEWINLSEHFKEKVKETISNKTYSEITSSKFETEIKEFVSSLVDNLEFNSRKLIYPLELDIYIPEKGIAIECNGMYWHSINLGKTIDYHLKKTELCKEEGIHLIHIFEWEWESKKEVCKSLIREALNSLENSIEIDECLVQELNKEDSDLFLKENSLLDFIEYDLCYGIFNNSLLVKAIYLKRREEDKFELVLCNKINTNVKQGLDFLISRLPTEIKSIYTLVDRGKFSEKEFLDCKWEIEEYTQPSCCYREQRFTKEGKVEYIEVYDSGKIKLKFGR